MDKFTSWIIPAIFLAFSLTVLVSKNEMHTAFVSGAKDGLKTAASLTLHMIILMCAISMLNASGAVEMVGRLLSPVLKAVGIPEEIVPLLVVRPVSGSAATAMLEDIFSRYGASSFAGRCASVLAGSTDTIIYTVSVYFSAAGIQKTRHTIPCAFITLFFAAVLSCLTVKIIF
ncbi:MAG: spore maturation protein [Clostridia bacterium]|nr:spore maturation protein [Clostridia bacterium]